MPTHAVTAPEAGVMMTAEKEYAEIPQAEPESPAPQPTAELQRSIFQVSAGCHARDRITVSEYAADMYENGNKIGVMG